jgi:hypothetical protein
MRLVGLISRNAFGGKKINEAKQYDIGTGWMPNGLTIWNRAEEDENGDYKRIADIDRKGNLKTYESLPSDIAKMLKIWADSIKKGGHPQSI